MNSSAAAAPSIALSLQRVLRNGAQHLARTGMAHARQEAAWLMSELIGTAPLELYLGDAPLPPRTAERFLSQIEARASGTPLQYLLGHAEFFGARFAVAPGVFIPRPETETIVEQAIRALEGRAARLGRPLRLLDAGTGSGCIAVTLACSLPACLVVGVELSWRALHIARANVQRHGVVSRVQLIQGDWLEALSGSFDGMVANPPYIPSREVDRLPLDVRQEPRLSLDGGEAGTRDLSRLLGEAHRILSPGGVCVLECAEEQAGPFAQRAAAMGWAQEVAVLRDLADRPRGILARRTE